MEQVEPRFKKGQRVIMFKCDEALRKKGEKKKVWVCTEDSFQRLNRLERKQDLQVVQLKGFNGRFWCKYLKLAK